MGVGTDPNGKAVWTGGPVSGRATYEPDGHSFIIRLLGQTPPLRLMIVSDVAAARPQALAHCPISRGAEQPSVLCGAVVLLRGRGAHHLRGSPCASAGASGPRAQCPG